MWGLGGKGKKETSLALPRLEKKATCVGMPPTSTIGAERERNRRILHPWEKKIRGKKEKKKFSSSDEGGKGADR